MEDSFDAHTVQGEQEERGCTSSPLISATSNTPVPPVGFPTSQPAQCPAGLSPGMMLPKLCGKPDVFEDEHTENHCKVQMGDGLGKVLRDQEKSPV